jgi:hypothetical protein
MRAGASSIAPKYHTRLALVGKQVPPALRYARLVAVARSARGLPVHYRDKPIPTPERGSDCMLIRGPNSMPFDISAVPLSFHGT